MNLKMDPATAFRKSIETLLDFVHSQVNANKTLVFFRTYAPSHFRFYSMFFKYSMFTDSLILYLSIIVYIYIYDSFWLLNENPFLLYAYSGIT